MTNPTTQGMSKKPSTKVTDPHSISDSEAPNSIEASAAGVTCAARVLGFVPT